MAATLIAIVLFCMTQHVSLQLVQMGQNHLTIDFKRASFEKVGFARAADHKSRSKTDAVNRPLSALLAAHKPQATLEIARKNSNSFRKNPLLVGRFRPITSRKKPIQTHSSLSSQTQSASENSLQLENELTVWKLLKKVEIDADIKILYASETGPMEWSTQSCDSTFHVRFVYIRKNSSTNYVPLRETNTDAVQVMKCLSKDKRYTLTGYDVNEAFCLASRMHAPVVEMFYSNSVYKIDQGYWRFIERVRFIFENEGQVGQLVACYRAMAYKSWNESVAVGGTDDGPSTFGRYMSVIRPLAMIDWIVLKYNTPYLTENQKPSAPQLLDTNLENVMMDLKVYNALAKMYTMNQKEHVYNAIIDLIRRKKTASENTRLMTDKCVDDWIERTLKYSLKSIEETNRANKSNKNNNALDEFQLLYISVLGRYL